MNQGKCAAFTRLFLAGVLSLCGTALFMLLSVTVSAAQMFSHNIVEKTCINLEESITVVSNDNYFSIVNSKEEFFDRRFGIDRIVLYSIKSLLLEHNMTSENKGPELGITEQNNFQKAETAAGIETESIENVQQVNAYGNAGRLMIPELGINVGLNREPDPWNNWIGYLNQTDSAEWIEPSGWYKYQCVEIRDHDSQDNFGNICHAVVGHTIAYVYTADGNVKTYICTASETGLLDQNWYLLTATGEYTYNCPGDIHLLTCHGISGIWYCAFEETYL